MLVRWGGAGGCEEEDDGGEKDGDEKKEAGSSVNSMSLLDKVLMACDDFKYCKSLVEEAVEGRQKGHTKYCIAQY